MLRRLTLCLVISALVLAGCASQPTEAPATEPTGAPPTQQARLHPSRSGPGRPLCLRRGAHPGTCRFTHGNAWPGLRKPR